MLARIDAIGLLHPAGTSAQVRPLDTPASDDTQSSAAVLSSRLVSAVGASMSDGPVRPASTPQDRRL